MDEAAFWRAYFYSVDTIRDCLQIHLLQYQLDNMISQSKQLVKQMQAKQELHDEMKLAEEKAQELLEMLHQYITNAIQAKHEESDDEKEEETKEENIEKKDIVDIIMQTQQPEEPKQEISQTTTTTTDVPKEDVQTEEARKAHEQQQLQLSNKIEEAMRECIERKKKIAILTAECLDENYIQQAQSMNELFHNVHDHTSHTYHFFFVELAHERI